MKSDSRVSIRPPGQGKPAPLSQRVVMPDFGRRVHRSTAGHDRVDSPSRTAHGRSDGSDVVTSQRKNSLGSRAAQFSRTAPLLRRRDSPSRHEPPQGRPSSISADSRSMHRIEPPRPGGTGECSGGVKECPPGRGGAARNRRREPARTFAFRPGEPCPRDPPWALRADRRRPPVRPPSLPPGSAAAVPRWC